MKKLSNIAGRFKTLAQSEAEISTAVEQALQATAEAAIPVEDLKTAATIGETIMGALTDALDWEEGEAVEIALKEMTVRGKPMTACVVRHGGGEFILHLRDKETDKHFVPSTTWAAAIEQNGRVSISAMLTMPAEACKHFGIAFVKPNSELPK